MQLHTLTDGDVIQTPFIYTVEITPPRATLGDDAVAAGLVSAVPPMLANAVAMIPGSTIKVHGPAGTLAFTVGEDPAA